LETVQLSPFAAAPPEWTASIRTHGDSSENMSWMLDALRVQGYAIVKLSEAEQSLVEALFARSRDFFAAPEKYKESFKFFPVPGGYLTPYPGTYEIFELKRGLIRCPSELAGQAMGAFRLLEQLASRIAAAIGNDIGVDLAGMPSESSPAMRCIHYDRPLDNRGARDDAAEPPEPPPVGATVRVVGYEGADFPLNGMKATVEASDLEGAQVLAEEATPRVVLQARGGSRSLRLPLKHLRLINPKAPGVYSAHTDSSLITVAPRSSASGLEAKNIRTGEWFMVEDYLQQDECLVFVGDPADYASAHRYPALMHRPAVAREGRAKGGRHRISTPYFLYPQNSAILRPDKGLPSLIFDDLNGNVNQCRDRFPWKRLSCYYSDLVYSETPTTKKEEAEKK